MVVVGVSLTSFWHCAVPASGGLPVVSQNYLENRVVLLWVCSGPFLLPPSFFQSIEYIPALAPAADMIDEILRCKMDGG